MVFLDFVSVFLFPFFIFLKKQHSYIVYFTYSVNPYQAPELSRVSEVKQCPRLRQANAITELSASPDI